MGHDSNPSPLDLKGYSLVTVLHYPEKDNKKDTCALELYACEENLGISDLTVKNYVIRWGIGNGR